MSVSSELAYDTNSILEAVRAILPERTVFSPEDFTMAKLPIVMSVLRADERRVCLLVDTAAKEYLEYLSGVLTNQSQNDVMYVLFQHDSPLHYSGLAHSLHIENTHRKIHDLFCPPPSGECVICFEECATDIEDTIVEFNCYPLNLHPDGVVYKCKGCLSVVCSRCYPDYFNRHHTCPVCNVQVEHAADYFGIRGALARLPDNETRYELIQCLASR